MCKKLIYLTSFILLLVPAGNAMAQIDPATVTTGHAYLLDDVNDVDGTVPDDSANDNTGIIVGDPNVVDGLAGKALLFDGVDDGVHIPDAAGINLSTHQNHTVVAVFKCADVDKSEKQCVYEEGGSTRGLTIYVHEGLVYAGGWNLSDYTPEWTGTFLSAPISSNQWVTVAAVLRDGGPGQEDDKFEMWMDGQLIGTGPGGQLQSRSDDNGIGNVQGQTIFHDGGVDAGGYWFEGTIDEVWILNEALGKVPVALGPTPANGSLHADTWANLSWKPGGFAVTQDVYFGDNLDDVNAGTGGTFLGSLSLSAAGVAVGNLLPETTYYWRVDAVNDVNPDSPWIGQVWSFTIPTQTAYDPTPADGALFVNLAITLSWTPGVGATTHTVYLADNFDDVNDSTGGIAQSDPNFTPEQPLETGKVYYWRIDEFDGTDTHKGDIWSFETPPFIEITDPNLIGWWKLDGEYFDLGYVIDYSGYDHHGTLRGDPQLVDGYDGGALEFDGTDDYVSIDGYKGILGPNPFSITAWINTSASSGTLMGWGSTGGGTTRFEFRPDADELRAESSGNVQGLTKLPNNEWIHVAVTVKADAIITEPDVTLYLNGQVDNDPSTGGSAALNMAAGYDVTIARRHTSGRFFDALIDDLRLYDKELTELEVKIISGFVMSGNPDPADGAKVVDTFAILGWTPGPFGAEFDVYFGTNPEPGADELVGRVSEPTHFATGLVEGQTYYWRVDDVEADGTTIHTGDLWSFWIPPQGAYNPQPADGQEVTDTETDLNWSADWNPVMYGVYIEDNADEITDAAGAPPTMETTFEPGSLEPGATYYWRVDVFYGTWVTGPIWSFSVSVPEEAE